jgi:antitoxin component of RelBE/YafQ-DinJ toxin-antitoxin module
MIPVSIGGRMKRIALALVMLALFVCPVSAQVQPDVYFEETIVSPPVGGQPALAGTISTWMSGGKLKMQSPEGEVMIYRADLDKVFMVNPIQRTYIEMPMASIRSMTEGSIEMYLPMKDGKVPDQIYKKTGKTKKIGSWNTHEVEVAAGQSAPGMTSKTTMWVSSDTGFGHDLMVRLFRATMGQKISPKMQMLFEKLASLDGYPVQTITTSTFNQQTITTTKTLKKIEKREKIEPSVFEIPKDYTKVQVPTHGAPAPTP